MKIASLTLAVLALVGSQSILAQTATPRTRADVKAEAASAVKDGTIDNGEATKPVPPMKSTTTRAKVKRDAASAEKAGTIGKGEGPAPAASRPNQASRAAVRAEAASAEKNGKIGKGPDVKQ